MRNVTVRYFATLTDGDKVATGHGQKGVVILADAVDMPFVVTDSGECVTPDLVVPTVSPLCFLKLHQSRSHDNLKSPSSLHSGTRLIY